MDIELDERFNPIWKFINPSKGKELILNADIDDLVQDRSYPDLRSNSFDKEKRKIKRSLYIASFGLFFNISAYYGLVNLQSSLNIQDGLGTTGLAVGYVTSLFWALLLTPLAIENLGPRNSMIISEMTYVIYCVANFYPSFYTIIPGAVFLGFGEACCWASMSVMVTKYGEQYWAVADHSAQYQAAKTKRRPRNKDIVSSNATYDGRNFSISSDGSQTNRLDQRGFAVTTAGPADGGLASKDEYVSRFFSTYFSIIKTSQIVGNLLSYVALYAGAGGDDNHKSNGEHPSYHNRSITLTTQSAPVDNRTADISLCGINDCPAAFHTASQESLSRYLTSDKMSVPILLGIFVVMHGIAIAMHFFLLEPLPKASCFSKSQGDAILLHENNKETDAIYKWWNRTKTTLKSLFRQMMSPKQLLVSPIALYFGLFLSYSLSKFTKAFVSCTMGVKNVGLLMMLFGATGIAGAFFFGKAVPKVGRNRLYLLAVIIDLCTYLSNFMWTPNEGSNVALYIMAMALGFNFGLWEPLINSTYAHYFANTSTAFSLWNFWGAAGLCVGFTLSSFVCLKVILYILIALLIFAVACYALAEASVGNALKVAPSDSIVVSTVVEVTSSTDESS